MLDKLEQIANQLDESGCYKEATAITGVMQRIAQWMGDNEGPIQDFNQDFETSPLKMGSEDTQIMRIHSFLRAKGIDPSGLSDQSAAQIYDALMHSDMSQVAYASNEQRVKKIG